MNIKDLLNAGVGITLAVKPEELKTILKEMVGSVKEEKQSTEEPEYLTRKEVLSYLQIDSSTLWNWEKTGYVNSYPFGGRKRYSKTEIIEIKQGKRVSNK